jgi:isocitrate dehydrogenase kinase/phosphatase
MGLPAAELAAVREHYRHLFDPQWWQGCRTLRAW